MIHTGRTSYITGFKLKLCHSRRKEHTCWYSKTKREGAVYNNEEMKRIIKYENMFYLYTKNLK